MQCRQAVRLTSSDLDAALTDAEDIRKCSERALLPFLPCYKPRHLHSHHQLFCDTPNGAQASAIVYTMVEMAKANGVNVYHYLTYLLEKLPNDRMSDEELDRLAPWNKEVKAEIERRANDSNQ